MHIVCILLVIETAVSTSTASEIFELIFHVSDKLSITMSSKTLSLSIICVGKCTNIF